jgi:hypothetical protein
LSYSLFVIEADTAVLNVGLGSGGVLFPDDAT